MSDSEGGGHASGPGNAANQLELYTSSVPHWRSLWSGLSNQRAASWAIPQLHAAGNEVVLGNHDGRNGGAVGMDPVQFRLMHITRPQPGDSRYPYDSFSLRWRCWKREPRRLAGTRGIQCRAARRAGSSEGSASACRSTMAGHLGYHDGEKGLRELAAAVGPGRRRLQHRTGADR